MSEPRRIGGQMRAFEDLALASDELLRQVAMSVHIIDLAYAFGSADESLRERLLNCVRPGLAEQIRSGIKTVQAESDRFPPEESIRAARSRVLEVARTVVMEDA